MPPFVYVVAIQAPTLRSGMATYQGLLSARAYTNLSAISNEWIYLLSIFEIVFKISKFCWFFNSHSRNRNILWCLPEQGFHWDVVCLCATCARMWRAWANVTRRYRWWEYVHDRKSDGSNVPWTDMFCKKLTEHCCSNFCWVYLCCALELSVLWRAASSLAKAGMSANTGDGKSNVLLWDCSFQSSGN